MLGDDPSATTDAGDAETLITRAVAGFAVNVTPAVELPAAPEAVTVASPAAVDDVSTTVVLLLTPVVVELDDREPLLVDQLTVAAGSALPFASAIVASSVLVEVPLASIEVGDATTPSTRAVDKSATSVTLSVIDPAIADAVTLADPATAPRSVTVALPAAFVTVEVFDSVPNEVDQLTGAFTTGLPFASLIVASNVLVSLLLATILGGVAVNPATLAVARSPFSVTIAVEPPASVLAVTVADPATMPISVTCDVPLALVFVDADESVPRLVVQVISASGTKLPLASLTVTLKALVSVPFAAMLVGVATKLITLAVVPSGNRSTVAVIGPATAVALTLAVPDTAPRRVTLALPLALVAVEELDSVPSVVVQVTGAPETALPLASRIVASIELVLVLSAAMAAGVATNEDTRAVAKLAVNVTGAVALPAAVVAVTVDVPTNVDDLSVITARLDASVMLLDPDNVPSVAAQVT